MKRANNSWNNWCERNEGKINGVFMFFNFSVAVFLLLSGTSLYWIGYHNKDLGWNMRWLNVVFNTTLVDEGSSVLTGEKAIFTAERGISVGYHQQNVGVMGIFLGAVALGMSLMIMVFRYSNTVKKDGRG